MQMGNDIKDKYNKVENVDMVKCTMLMGMCIRVNGLMIVGKVWVKLCMEELMAGMLGCGGIICVMDRVCIIVGLKL